MDDKLTTKDAITVLRSLQDWLYLSGINGGTSLQREAIDIAIEALSKESETVYCKNCAYAEKYVDGLIFCRRTKTAFRVSDMETCGKGKREVTNA